VAKIFIKEEEKTIEIKVGENILEAALGNGIDLDHACGGVCACSSCHIKIREGIDCFNEATEDEEDQLDNARDIELCSRLACQAVLQEETSDLIKVEIPFWNVNLVQEGPEAAHA
jgi:2Fe-2S ferredoxin|tara:strand:- start:793 stop:1137 length:345 start_codon:yes stop_codon:yes gene_type:complete